MSSIIRKNVNYGFNQPLNLENPQSIVANRAPTVNDKAPIGQEWVYSSLNEVYILTSIVANVANWQLLQTGGSAGVFSSLTVNPGPTNLSTIGNGSVTIGNATNTGDIDIISGSTGDINITTTAGGDLNITGGAGIISISVGAGNLDIDGHGHSINIGTDAAANLITIGTSTVSSTTTINGSSISLSALNSNIAISSTLALNFSPTNSVTINSRVIRAAFGGFTIAPTDTQVFTVNSSFIGTSSGIQATVYNLNTSGNNAAIAIRSMQLAAGLVNVEIINNGSGTSSGSDTIFIVLWIMN